MGVETFDVKQVVSVTPQAAEHFRKQLEKSGKQSIRLTLKVSGCTGFKYVIDEVDSAEQGDVEVVLENGVLLSVDPKKFLHCKACR